MKQDPRRAARRRGNHDIKNILRRATRGIAREVGADGRAVHHRRQRILQAQRIHRPVRARARVEAQVQRARSREPGDAVARHAVEGREVAAHHHLAVLLHAEGIDGTVGTRARIEAGVHAAIHVQTGDTVPVGAIETGEVTSNEHPSVECAIRVNQQCPHGCVGPGARVESAVQHTVGVHSGDEVPSYAVVGREAAAEHNLAVVRVRHEVGRNRHRRDDVGVKRNNRVGKCRIYPNRRHEVIRPDPRAERGVQRAIQIHARDTAALEGVDCRKVTADDRLPILLHRGGEDGVIRTWHRVLRRDGAIVVIRVVVPVKNARGIIVVQNRHRGLVDASADPHGEVLIELCN